MWFRNVDQRQLGKPPGLRQLESRRRTPVNNHSRNHADIDHIITGSADPASTPFKSSSSVAKPKTNSMDAAPLWVSGRPNSAPALLRGQGLLLQAQDVVKDGFLQNVENHAVRSAVADLRRGYLQTRDMMNSIDCLTDTHLAELRVHHNRKQRASWEKSKLQAAETAAATPAGRRKKAVNGAAEQTRKLCLLLESQSIASPDAPMFRFSSKNARRGDHPHRADSVTIAKDFARSFQQSNSRSTFFGNRHSMHVSRADAEREILNLVQFFVARFGTMNLAWDQVKRSGGSISSEEWKANLLSMGYESDPGKIFHALDQDGNGVMTWEELEEGLQVLMPGIILKGEEESPPEEAFDDEDVGAAADDARASPSRNNRGNLEPLKRHDRRPSHAKQFAQAVG
mmetsp:Transcript_17956/g.41902  ORF Transcript_17956/g.41902 Transcript_17956/m.41902 type:complete len:398 (+) Transcript_17956:40-1233(+)